MSREYNGQFDVRICAYESSDGVVYPVWSVASGEAFRPLADGEHVVLEIKNVDLPLMIRACQSAAALTELQFAGQR
ncbi:MAG TPA: hypothetical protein VI968_01920 [archaeon]|nr:hypothetical protein [archaeon]